MAGIKPQPGPQEAFLSAQADIAIYGGAAGGGKSFALLMEPLRHIGKADFSAVFFRRSTTQIRNPGGLWDESRKLYAPLGLRARPSSLEWLHANGSRIKLAHLEHEATVYDWQGAQVPLICFDELTHFTRDQFFYMLSRNRSTCGVRPYVRATTNPDADSWVAGFIAWWIDAATGLPIPERAGKVRWFARIGDTLDWADTREEILAAHGPAALPKSATFIPATLADNAILMAADPGYRANLMALSLVERLRLMDGNWKVRPAAGLMFRRSWCETVEAAPADLTAVRYWDLAATEAGEGRDPDWTVGLKLGRDPATGLYYLLDAVRLRGSPAKVETAIANTASGDGMHVRIGLPQDPGQAGKSQAGYLARRLAGYAVSTSCERGNKVTRFGPFSAQAEAGNIRIVRGAWNADLADSLEAFPEAAHDDDADACAGAFAMLQSATTGLIDFYKHETERLHAGR